MKRRLMSSLLCICMLIGLLPMTFVAHAAIQTGTQGSITWEIDTETGVLTFSGSGAITPGGAWNQYRNAIRTIVIEDGISSIESSTFAGISTLTSVSIPESVTNIGSAAFISTGLTSVVIPNSVKSIGASAFYSCTSLRDVEILAYIETIEQDTFGGCTSLTEFAIPEGVVTVLDNAFNGCSNLEKVTIPKTVETISNSAFGGCVALSEMIIDEDNANFCIDELGVLYNKEKTELLYALPSVGGTYVVPEGVQIIADSAFRGNQNLTTVTFSDSVSTIGSYAFSSCAALQEVSFGTGITSIGADAFNASGLTAVTIPNSVTTLGIRAFANCKALTTAKIGDGVEAIDGYTFQYCTSLDTVVLGEKVASIGTCSFYGTTALKQIELPDTLTTIAARAFENSAIESVAIPASTINIANTAFDCCKNVTAYTVDPENPNYCSDSHGALFNKDKTTLITFPGAYSGAYVIPASVLTIDYNAFAYCDGLTNITIPDTVTSIGGKSFMYCEGLTDVVLPNGITKIEYDVFVGCVNLESVYIPEGVTSIGNYAFENCNSLKQIVIPEGTETIGVYAFKNCDSLQSVTIPVSLTKISNNAFFGANQITAVYYGGSEEAWGQIKIESNNSALTNAEIYYNAAPIITYPVEGGNIYIERATGLVIDADETITAAEIPQMVEGVTVVGIGDKAFYYCKSLEAVSIPETVTSIGEYGFYYCSALKEIDIPDGVSEIGTFAFNLCHTLTRIEIPSAMTEIKKDTFSRCNNLETVVIPESIKTIGDHAFYDCPKLMNVTIPDGVETIENWAFAQTGIVEIKVPDSVTNFGYSMFYGCKNLTSVTLGKGITTIPNQCFAECDSLVAYEIPAHITALEHSVFSGCGKLEQVMLPEGIGTIPLNTFNSCTALKSIIIPDSVKTVGSGAFNGCSALESVVIGSGVETFENYQNFASTTSLIAFTVDEANENFVAVDGVLFNKEQTELVFYPGGLAGAYVIPDGVQTINAFAFYGANKLTSITIPAGMETIGMNAFTNCSGLENVVIGEGVETIPENTFAGCTGIKTVTIPASVKTIGASAFAGTWQITDVYYGSTEADWALVEIDNSYSSNNFFINANIHYSEPIITYPVEGGNIYIERATGLVIDADETITAAEIPQTVEGVTVVGIGDKAFYYCKSLEAVSIPETVTSIGEYGFYYCSALKEIDIPDGVSEIGTFAFNLCHTLTRIEIPSAMTEIKKDTFSRCNNLETVVIPESIKTIGDHAFYDCPKLMNVTIPDGVETIENWAFAQTGIVEIKVPDSVTSFGDSMFYGCKNLESATIGTNITKLPAWTFYDCDSLTEFVIPNHITEIGDYAFGSCSKLESVTIPESVTAIGKGAFSGVEKMKAIDIPNSVKILGDSAVSGCTALETIKIGSGVESIGIQCFGNNPSLLAFEVNDKNENFTDIDGVLFTKDETELLSFTGGYTGSYSVPEGTKVIDEFAFVGATKLTEVIIPDGVQTIGQNAFTNCSAVTNVVIGEGAETIETYTFAGCTSLKTITIPASLKKIDSGAFSGTWQLTDVYYGSTEEDWALVQIDNSNNFVINANIHYTETYKVTWDVDGNVTEELYKVGQMPVFMGSTAKAADGCTAYDFAGWDTQLVPVSSDATYTATYTEREKHIAEVIDIAVAPTCTEAGLTEGSHCDACGKVIIAQNEVPSLGHSFTYTDNGDDHIVSCACGTFNESHNYVDYSCICGSKVVAVIGEVSYTQINDAFKAALDGDEVKLVNDATMIDRAVFEKDITIDLNGHTLTTYADNNNYDIVIKGDVVIADSGEVGKMIISGIYGIGVSTTSGSSLTIEAGEFTHNGDYMIGSWGTVTINGGNFDGGYCVVNAFAGEAEITDGYFSAKHDDSILIAGNTALYGGAYDRDVSEYCAESFIVELNGEVYLVKECVHEKTVTNRTESTCTSDGLEVISCAQCGKVIAESVLPMAEHSYSYTNNGENHTVTCKNGCDYSATEDHTFEDGKCICGAEEVTEPTKEFVETLKPSMSIVVGAEMSVAFTVNQSMVSKYESFYLVVEKDMVGAESKTVTFGYGEGQTALTPMPNATNPFLHNASFTGLTAKEMGDQIRATLYCVDADGKIFYGPTQTDSVKDYLMRGLDLATSTDAKKTMYVDMLRYGAVAQTYFQYDTENLVDADLTEAHMAYATMETPEAVDNSKAEGGLGTLNTSVVLKARVTLTLSHLKPGANLANMKFIVKDALDGTVIKELPAYNLNPVMIAADFDDVGAKQMRRLITVTLYDGDTAITDTVTWSVESYVAKTRATSTDAGQIDLVNAMLTYGDAVAAYMATQ